MLSENINLNFLRHNFLHINDMNQCSGLLSLILGLFYFFAPNEGHKEAMSADT